MDLPDVDLLRGQAGPVERLRDRERRGDPHDPRIERVGRRRDHARERLRAELVRRPGAREHDGARAVVQRRGVPGRHLGGVRLSRERGELLGRRVRANAFVVLERAPGLLAARRDLDRMDLQREPSRIARRGRVQVGAQREGVDLLAGQLVVVGDVLRGPHHVDVRVSGEQGRVRRATCAGPHRVEHQNRSTRHERRVALDQRPARA